MASSKGVGSTTALASGGNTPGSPAISGAVEEWTGAGAPIGAWSTGANLSSAKRSVFTAGTQTAALAAGGSNDDTPAIFATTELYDGTSWTEVNDLNVAKFQGGTAGTQTSALAFAGRTPPTVRTNESWNGTNWTEVADLNTPNRHGLGGAGISNTSALSFGGFDPVTFPGPTGGRLPNTESWNGSSWTEVNDLNTGRTDMASGHGTATSALSSGGNAAPGITGVTESWNGTNWTEVNDLNTARGGSGSAGADNTSGLVFGGTPPTTGKTEEWNGVSWVETSDMTTARTNLNGALRGTTSASLAVGGNVPPITAATEEWNKPSNTVKTLTD
jgi:hypothetical protein